jgi:hypothetical protein
VQPVHRPEETVAGGPDHGLVAAWERHDDMTHDTSEKRTFGLDPLVPASIWAGTKGPATSSQNRLAAQEALVPARNEPLVPV